MTHHAAKAEKVPHAPDVPRDTQDLLPDQDGGRGIGLAGQHASLSVPVVRRVASIQPEETIPRLTTWQLSNRFDPSVLPLADRHYNRQKPGSPQFMPAGSCLVLKLIEHGRVAAFWGTSWPQARYVRHQWAGAWLCSAFRNESSHLSSTLIRDALAATRWHYGDVPALGMITFVNPGKVRHKRDPGRCFLKAGFVGVGTTGSGLLAFQILAADMPEPQPPATSQIGLDFGEG